MSNFRPVLNQQLDAARLHDAFAEHGRIRISTFLEPICAEQLHAALRARGDWHRVISNGGTVTELTRAAWESVSAQQRAQVDEAVYAAARSGFQFRYETIRVADADEDRRGSDDPLAALASWMSGGAVRDLLRTITGQDGVEFVDAQATAFSPGDFLTGHDDVVDGRKRHAAYVLGLNPTWRTEWGGLLLFHDGGGVVGQAPGFNTLDLFSVGQMHSVSEVNRAAAYRRYSVTGWLRSR